MCHLTNFTLMWRSGGSEILERYDLSPRMRGGVDVEYEVGEFADVAGGVAYAEHGGDGDGDGRCRGAFEGCGQGLNQYQGGMCISGVLKTTERIPQHLISPVGPNWVVTDIAVQRYVHFTLALV